jgi:iron(III) transport system ATP-binding protein
VTAVIRLEQVRVDTSPGANRIPMALKTQMYLGERWELVLVRENLTVRAFAQAPLAEGEHQVEFPPQALWVF